MDMINICIVEDEREHFELLNNYINDWAKKNSLETNVSYFCDGIDLVDEYKGQFDIIFLDIQMKHLNGMVAAEKIRKLDNDVVISFITSTVQYAVQGYAVDALGYVLKPVSYVAFEKLFEKAVERVKTKQKKVYIKVICEDLHLKLDCKNIYYIESSRNNVIVHCRDGNYVTTGPLKRYEETLNEQGFSKCHNAYLVNLSHVEGVQKEEVLLSDGSRLPISRARKKFFLAELTEDII